MNMKCILTRIYVNFVVMVLVVVVVVLLLLLPTMLPFGSHGNVDDDGSRIFNCNSSSYANNF